MTGPKPRTWSGRMISSLKKMKQTETKVGKEDRDSELIGRINDALRYLEKRRLKYPAPVGRPKKVQS